MLLLSTAFEKMKAAYERLSMINKDLRTMFLSIDLSAGAASPEYKRYAKTQILWDLALTEFAAAQLEFTTKIVETNRAVQPATQNLKQVSN